MGHGGWLLGEGVSLRLLLVFVVGHLDTLVPLRLLSTRNSEASEHRYGCSVRALHDVHPTCNRHCIVHTSFSTNKLRNPIEAILSQRTVQCNVPNYLFTLRHLLKTYIFEAPSKNIFLRVHFEALERGIFILRGG